MGVRDQKRKHSLEKKREVREKNTKEDLNYKFNYLITLVYDGYPFGGYAKQKHNNTIQDNLESALETILKVHVKTIESSRTDAKVHARNQKVMFKYFKEIDTDKLFKSLNRILPDSIVVKEVEAVSSEFHCRYDVKNKTYTYHITKKYDPFTRHYKYFHPVGLNVSEMKKACNAFIGEHDFTSFCSAQSTQESKIRTIYSLNIIETDTEIKIVINGSGFLYNMVRIIVGTLLDVGVNKTSVKEVRKILLAKDRKRAGTTAPAHGLFLDKINY